jgi:hypothetical protein
LSIGVWHEKSLGFWKLDGNSNDLSGNAYNGTDSNMSYGTGNFENCGIFNGSSGRIALPTTSPNLRPTTFTILTWYGGTDADGTILSNKCTATSKYYGYFLDIGTNLVRCQVCAGTGLTEGTHMKTVSGVTDVHDNVWHLIGATFDGSTIAVYVDGHKENSASWSTIGYTTTQYPMIGCLQLTTGAYSSYLAGQLDEVIITDRALSEQDMRRWFSYSIGMLD